MDFPLKDWSNPIPVHLKAFAEKELFVTKRDLAFWLTTINGMIQVNPVPQIASKQEETDTKMFLSSQHTHSLGFLRVNIVAVDFNVYLPSLYYQSRVGAHLSLEYGSSKKTVIFDIAANTVDKDLIDALPGLHALTGCDSASCFSGQGMLKSLQLLKKNERYNDAAKLQGESLEPLSTVKEVLEEFTCWLYGVEGESQIGSVRYKLFCKSEKVPDPQRYVYITS